MSDTINFAIMLADNIKMVSLKEAESGEERLFVTPINQTMVEVALDVAKNACEVFSHSVIPLEITASKKHLFPLKIQIGKPESKLVSTVYGDSVSRVSAPFRSLVSKSFTETVPVSITDHLGDTGLFGITYNIIQYFMRLEMYLNGLLTGMFFSLMGDFTTITIGKVNTVWRYNA